MPQETIVNTARREAQQRRTREWLKQRQQELGMVKNAPSVAAEQPYTYENGTPYEPPTKSDSPLIPDQGFDGPA
jgi:hypothetical protein